MDLKEYVLPHNTFIGGWYIPTDLCDALLKIYKDNPKNHSVGVVGALLRIDPLFKESTEISIAPHYQGEAFKEYKKYFPKLIHRYEQKYPEVHDFDKFGMIEPCQIQHYKPGQGFKSWHCERMSKENRCLVFMTFLNTVPSGGTQFKYQNLTVPAKKGLTLIWPTDFTHTHKGQITQKHEKYIITGWLGFI